MTWTGGRTGDRSFCVVAPNSSPMTLEGTNSWILREPGRSKTIVVDPGPLDAAHLEALAHAADEVALVLLTHFHQDHSAAAQEFAATVHAPVRARDSRLCVDADPLNDDERLVVDGLEVRILATPGHTRDSVCAFLPGDGALLSGDTILGRGSTVLEHPEGNLKQYLASLDQLQQLAVSCPGMVILPGHGPAIADGAARLRWNAEHRQQRLGEVTHALEVVESEGSAPGAWPSRIVQLVYADVDPQLWPAAERSVQAQLAFLAKKPHG